jgi:hypothetical protein
VSLYINIPQTVAFVDISGAPLPYGQLTITPSSGFRIGANAGQVIDGKIERAIVNGALSAPLRLADPAQTSPEGIGYTFTATDANGNQQTWENVLIVADSNGNFDLAALNTGQFITAVPQTVISVTGGQAEDNQVLSLTSGAQPVSAFTVAANVSGTAVTASSGNPAMLGKVVGLFLQSVQANSPVEIQFSGLVTYNGWNFTPGPVFLSSTGVLTQSVPGAGFLQTMGVAQTPTSVLLSVQPPITIQ